MVVVGQYDVLGSSGLSRELDELKDKCEILEQENSMAEKELAKLETKAELADSLQEEVKRYSSPSTFTTQITKLKASLAEGEKHWNKASEDAAEAYIKFEEDQ